MQLVQWSDYWENEGPGESLLRLGLGKYREIETQGEKET